MSHHDDGLLRVSLSAFTSGYVSALINSGAPPATAIRIAQAVARGIKADPIPRNRMVDDALALYQGHTAAPGEFMTIRPERDNT